MIVTLLTIVFLIAMWVAVLAAPVIQNRGASARGGDSIKTFQRQLAVLERAAPAVGVPRHGGSPNQQRAQPALRAVPSPYPPVSVRRQQSGGRIAAQRRRRIVFGLLGTMGVTLVAAFLLGGWFVLAHLAADALFVAYVALMVRTMRIVAEREMKVAFLPHRESVAEPTALLAEVGAGHARRG